MGVFADGATQGQEDIIGQVVEKSWEELPKSSPSSAALKRANADRTKTLWMRIGLGLLLIAVANFSADRRPEQNVQKARPTAGEAITRTCIQHGTSFTAVQLRQESTAGHQRFPYGTSRSVGHH